jgi:hypothetical protein
LAEVSEHFYRTEREITARRCLAAMKEENSGGRVAVRWPLCLLLTTVHDDEPNLRVLRSLARAQHLRSTSYSPL